MPACQPRLVMFSAISNLLGGGKDEEEVKPPSPVKGDRKGSLQPDVPMPDSLIVQTMIALLMVLKLT